MYYDLDKVAKEKYENGQLLLYTPLFSFTETKPEVIIVEKQNAYDAKTPGMPTETRIDPHYVNGSVSDAEVIPIDEESHPEVFVKLGFRL